MFETVAVRGVILGESECLRAPGDAHILSDVRVVSDINCEELADDEKLARSPVMPPWMA